MDKVILYNNLFDIYENTLTENKKELFVLYYKENLSMQEIADEKKVSKAFVGKVIKEVEKKLEQLERDFKLLKIKDRLNYIMTINDVNTIKSLIKDVNDII